jgi:hypothetical protein
LVYNKSKAMIIENRRFVFNEEERHISELPEVLALHLVGFAFNSVRRARKKCLEEYCALLTCDLDPATDLEMYRLPSYPPKLRSLDELSFSLGILTDSFYMTPTVSDQEITSVLR